MAVLLLKLALTPALIGALSVVGRRWGPSVSGWLVGLPLTSGPVALFLALGQGATFGARAAGGILAGTFSAGVFCLAYSWLAFPCAWWLTLPASWLAFLAVTFGLRQVTLPPPPLLFAAVITLLLLVLVLVPRAVATRKATAPPRWDIPARMLIATVFVLALTSLGRGARPAAQRPAGAVPAVHHHPGGLHPSTGWRGGGRATHARCGAGPLRLQHVFPHRRAAARAGGDHDDLRRRDSCRARHPGDDARPASTCAAPACCAGDRRRAVGRQDAPREAVSGSGKSSGVS